MHCHAEYRLSTSTVHQCNLPMSSSSSSCGMHGFIAVHVSHSLRQRQLRFYEQKASTAPASEIQPGKAWCSESHSCSSSLTVCGMHLSSTERPRGPLHTESPAQHQPLLCVRPGQPLSCRTLCLAPECKLRLPTGTIPCSQGLCLPSHPHLRPLMSISLTVMLGTPHCAVTW